MITQALPLFDVSGGWEQAFWASYAAWLASEIWIFLRDLRSVRGRAVDRGSRRLVVTTLLVCICLAFWIAHGGLRIGVGQLGQAILPATARPAMFLPPAITLMWAGMALRFWAVCTLGRHFRTAVIVQEGHELVQRGPYCRVRNPSYTGSLLTLLGVGLALGNSLSLGVLLVGPLLAYLWRIHAEEEALAARFGPLYQRYRARTWALLPWVW